MIGLVPPEWRDGGVSVQSKRDSGIESPLGVFVTPALGRRSASN